MHNIPCCSFVVLIIFTLFYNMHRMHGQYTICTWKNVYFTLILLPFVSLSSSPFSPSLLTLSISISLQCSIAYQSIAPCHFIHINSSAQIFHSIYFYLAVFVFSFVNFHPENVQTRNDVENVSTLTNICTFTVPAPAVSSVAFDSYANDTDANRHTERQRTIRQRIK